MSFFFFFAGSSRRLLRSDSESRRLSKLSSTSATTFDEEENSESVVGNLQRCPKVLNGDRRRNSRLHRSLREDRCSRCHAQPSAAIIETPTVISAGCRFVGLGTLGTHSEFTYDTDVPVRR